MDFDKKFKELEEKMTIMEEISETGRLPKLVLKNTQEDLEWYFLEVTCQGEYDKEDFIDFDLSLQSHLNTMEDTGLYRKHIDGKYWTTEIYNHGTDSLGNLTV